MNECYHACPTGKDDQCPGGKTCHSWLTCTPSQTNPATYNVCGRNWPHAASTCGTRCFMGSDDSCPQGQTCFGGVADCKDSLPPLTAEDVGLEEKSYTGEEIKVLLDEEIAKERDEEAMSDMNNWWCGSSWSNMLETCSKKCQTDDDCKPDAWTDGYCFKTTGGPDNCSTPGVPVKAAVAPGSRWCGSTWNSMLETCAQKCEQDEDCPGNQMCWEAPDTCQWVGVPVKEASDPLSLWCGLDYDHAMTSCTRACPGESDDDCPEGMSCFSGSSCTEEGVPIVREGYRCGKDWNDASKQCGIECQKNSDCDTDNDEKCFAEVVCESELKEMESAGMYCGITWEGTAKACTESCEEDDDCPGNQWCYWVECEDRGGPPEDEDGRFDEPTTTEPPLKSCSPEVRQCPNGQFVGRAPILNCDFYPCPEGGTMSENMIGPEREDPIEDVEDVSANMMVAVDAPAAAKPANSGGESTTSDGTTLSNWGSEPLQHACTSNSSGSCGMCQGDCNSDADCQPGLLCFSRGQGEMTSVPGCVSGGSGDKPGMDYCYTPWKPVETTTTTTTTSTTTTTTTPPPDMQTGGFMSAEAYISAGNNVGTLDYARECTASNPCGACEGDCDINSHCKSPLKCYSRAVGSVDLVPGCSGLGIAGELGCYVDSES